METINIQTKKFKEENKSQSSSTEHSEKQPPKNLDLAKQGDKLKLGTPDNLKSSGAEIKKEASTDDTKGKDAVSKENTIPSYPQGVKLPPSPILIYKQLIEDWEIDSGVFYGTSGSCKTKLAVFLALD